MRLGTLRLLLLTGIAYLAVASIAYGRSAPQNGGSGTAKATTTAATPATAAVPIPANPAKASDPASQPGETLSLAESARLARAKKQSTARPAKVLDDDNFVRTQYPADSVPGGGAGGQNSAASKGKFVLLDFWASWCGPCRSALPGLKRLQATYGEQLQVISISADDDEATWRAFVASNDMRWRQRWDADGRLRAKYAVDAFPTYILLGPDGKVVQRLEGEDPTQSIGDRLGPSLRASADGPR